MKKLLLIFTLIFISSPSSSTESKRHDISSLLWFRDSFGIAVTDGVKNGCLPRPAKIKEKIEIGLRRNNFSIVESSSTSTDIHFEALGGEISDNFCVVMTNVKLIFGVLANIPFANGEETVITHSITLSSGYHYNYKSNMQSELEKIASDAVDQLFLNIKRSEDKIKKNHPELIEKHNRLMQIK